MDSFKQISFMDQSATIAMLKNKVNQNFMVDLDVLKYNLTVQPLIECLLHSPLIKALMMFEKVPISHFRMSYSIGIYNNALDVMNFEVHGHKTSNSKAIFCKFLGFSFSQDAIKPDAVSISRLITVFHQMGYHYNLSLLPKFKKSTFPPNWKALFTILFKCLSEIVIGSDSASKVFYTSSYGIFSTDNIDYGTIIWSQFSQSMSSNTKDSHIAYA